MVHDASTGFHDIKPLPLFSPLPLRELLAAAFILGSLALIVWYFNRARRIINTVPAAPPLSPYERALKEFDSIEREVRNPGAQLRGIGTRASLALRAYFGALFSFPATEQTSKEFSAALGGAITSRADFREDLLRRISAILRFCDWLTFSDQSEARYAQDRSELVKRISDAKLLIEEEHARRIAAEVQGPDPQEVEHAA